MAGGKKDSNTLGRSIIRERRGVASAEDKDVVQLRHHSLALEDGPSWTRLRSVTEQTDLDELLAVAELAGSEFTAERTTSNFVSGDQDGSQVLQRSLARLSKEDEAEAKGWLRIPRRPRWDFSTTPEELRQREQNDFLIWRRRIAQLEEEQQRHQLSLARGQVLNTVNPNLSTVSSSFSRFILTPFERNLDIWRQLWRVVEQSSVLVQIVDARNPMLFFCSDLFEYVREQSTSKRLLLLLNKADLLTEAQRSQWSEYLNSQNIDHAFYSAFVEGQKIENEIAEPVETTQSDIYSYSLLTRDQLLYRLHELADGGAVGMVGYPNVGKSSTINSLVGQKKVAVAATPGKTKHFQTLSVDISHLSLGILNLCDCPGLVFPNFTATRADLVLNGVLPIDQLREWLEPVALLVQRVPRSSLEQIYGVDLATFDADGQPRPLGAHDLLAAHAQSRGFKTSMHGNPDEARSARIVLKDYVNGKLLFCHPPPDSTDESAYLQMTVDRVISEIKPRPKLLQTGLGPDADRPAYQDDALLGRSGGFSTRSVGQYTLGSSGRATVGGSMPLSGSKKHFKNKRN